MSIIQSKDDAASQNQHSYENNADIPDKSGAEPFKFDDEISIRPMDKDKILQKHQSLIDEVEDFSKDHFPQMHGQTM